jgi:O-antigen ligase
MWLIGFAAVAAVSLIMPILINGRLLISSPILGEESDTPLYLTPHNITQLLYLVFGLLIAICVAHANLRDEQRHDTERVILISALFVSIWGVFQFVCNLSGITYPAFIFNNSGSVSGRGFMQTLDTGVSRVTSAAVEPSVLAQGLVTLLPLTLPAWLKRGFILSRRMDRSASILFVLVLILSTSATAYLGLFLLAITGIVVLVRTGAWSMRRAVLSAVAAVTVVGAIIALALTSVPFLSAFADSVLLNKSSSGSALERAMTIEFAFGYFQKFPILGIGWGSATSHDLIVKLLSNVGVVGFVVFLGAMGSVAIASWRDLGGLSSPVSLSRSAWLLALAVFLLTSVLIEFPLVFGNFWLVLGMVLATSQWTHDPSMRPFRAEAQ